MDGANLLHVDQINCAGRRDAFPALDLMIEHSDPNLLAIAISEPPWFLKLNDYRSDDFHLDQTGPANKESSCGFFVNSRYVFRQTFLTNSNRVCAIQLDTDMGRCILISFYLQPSSLMGLTELE